MNLDAVGGVPLTCCCELWCWSPWNCLCGVEMAPLVLPPPMLPAVGVDGAAPTAAAAPGTPSPGTSPPLVDCCWYCCCCCCCWLPMTFVELPFAGGAKLIAGRRLIAPALHRNQRNPLSFARALLVGLCGFSFTAYYGDYILHTHSHREGALRTIPRPSRALSHKTPLPTRDDDDDVVPHSLASVASCNYGSTVEVIN